ncbi:LOW QUALITY PROTEIN: lysozyme g-like [Sylvia atricapilla]|uniref:LOW QUALITY PROTEIN: lysozyme g-like n=1 Tax=Sylvia atricapilla TaxID=48155 RepID=UPI0033989F37
MLLHCSERYGNILNVDTTGALEATVKPDGLSCQHRRIGAPWDTEEHSAQDTEILYKMINPEKNPQLGQRNDTSEVEFCQFRNPSHHLCSCVSFTLIPGGLSAYNAGVNTVHTYHKMDVGKTHNYANDVDVRARFYKGDGH